MKLLDRTDGDVQAEAQRLNAARSPHIVEVLQTGMHEGHPWIATRWVEGRTLAHLIATEGSLTVGRANRLIAQMATALDELHAAGIVHGDLSPNNMLVDLNDHLTLIDLGLEAHDPAAPELDSTSHVSVSTTPRYAAPEVAAGEAPGPAADRYALALIAFEALTGTSPYPAVATPVAMLGHHLHTEPVRASEERPALPGHIDPTILRGLAKRPEDRHPTAVTFAAELAGTESPSLLTAVGSSDEKPSWLRRFGVALPVVAIGVGALIFAATRSPADGDPLPEWIAGDAAALACNLTEVPGFEQVVPFNYFAPEPPNPPTTLVTGVGFDGSVGARIGDDGWYGLQAEMLEVQGGQTYVLDAWIQRQGDPFESGMWVNFLDANYQPISEHDLRFPSPVPAAEAERGERRQVIVGAPVDAAFAVPTFFKDASEGWLLVDEVVFGRADECQLPSRGES